MDLARAVRQATRKERGNLAVLAVAAAAVASIGTHVSVAQDVPTELTAQDRSAVIERVSALLEERYVFPEVAAECAAHLTAELQAGAFDDLSDPEAFAQGLTASLQSISHDKHMRVRVRQPDRVQVERENPARAQARQLAAQRADNFGFYKVERLEGNIGYIDMRYFAGTPDARPTATAAMNFLANVDALVFDMRQNGGGSPEMIRYITSYLFDQPTHLNSMYWRQGDRTDEFWTYEEVPGPRLADVPVFVLTSDYTFSGAEEFSYNLKNLGRATIIGETTGGGANPGGVVPVDDQFGIFIPTGRAINPISGTNWEGVGVEPDVKIDDQEAYDKAMEMATHAAEARRAEMAAALDAKWSAYEDSSRRALALLDAGDRDGAITAMKTAVQAANGAGLLAEPEINMLGYEFMRREQVALAIAVFETNADLYPESANVYDSLAEAYMNDGQGEKAIKFFSRSLELDPSNENAKAMIARIKESR